MSVSAEQADWMGQRQTRRNAGGSVVNKGFPLFNDIVMTQAISHKARQQPVDVPAALSLLIDIPRDVVPNIFSRLPGPAFFSLAQVCRQIRMEKNYFSKEWVSRELHEIGSLSGDELWTRFLDLTGNCAHLIDGVEWETFLLRAESRQSGSAVLLRMAGPTPRNATAADNPRKTLGMQDAARFDAILKAAMSDPLSGIGEGQQMARIKAAVLTGCWHHVIRHAAESEKILLLSLAQQIPAMPLETQMLIMPRVDSRQSDSGLVHSARQFMADRVAELPLALQLKIAPCLGVEQTSDYVVLLAYADMWQLHTSAMLQQFSLPLPKVNLASVSPSYLAGLVKMCQTSLLQSQHRLLLNAWISAEKLFTQSLVAGMAIGPWREQPAELALFLFLTLACTPGERSTDQSLQAHLIKSQFVTEAECREFRLCVPRQAQDKSAAVEHWIFLNRLEKPASACTVS